MRQNISRVKHIFPGVVPTRASFEERDMKWINILTLTLVIIGGLNWLLVGLFQFDLVAELFGGQTAGLSRLIYVLVGLSAVWQIWPLTLASSRGEVSAERAL
jgi:uncharacterized membrane protein YuzA (DUF378 family)